MALRPFGETILPPFFAYFFLIRFLFLLAEALRFLILHSLSLSGRVGEGLPLEA